MEIKINTSNLKKLNNYSEGAISDITEVLMKRFFKKSDLFGKVMKKVSTDTFLEIVDGDNVNDIIKYRVLSEDETNSLIEFVDMDKIDFKLFADTQRSKNILKLKDHKDFDPVYVMNSDNTSGKDLISYLRHTVFRTALNNADKDNKIWKKYSKYIGLYSSINKYADKLDWDIISARTDLTIAFLRSYRKYINWTLVNINMSDRSVVAFMNNITVNSEVTYQFFKNRNMSERLLKIFSKYLTKEDRYRLADNEYIAASLKEKYLLFDKDEGVGV